MSTTTAAELERVFAYHPPNEITQPKHAAIGAAFEALTARLVHELTTQPREAVQSFAGVNAACLACATVISEVCPPSADATAAIRCLRLARNAANEIIVIRDQVPDAITLRHVLDAELLKARWQANAAIALERP